MASFRNHLMFAAWLFSALLFLQGDGSFVGCSGSRRGWGSYNHATMRPSSKQQQTTVASHVGELPSAKKTNRPSSSSVSSRCSELIEVSTEIDLPFPKSVAFDAFADLSRQSTFSPWLKSVEYLDGANQNSVGTTTRWTLSYMGLRFSWNAVSTRQDREHGVIEWESVTGMKNNGRVEFHEVGDDRTHMKMTMRFRKPVFANRMLGESGKIASMVENRILKSTLLNFRQDVLENDWRQKQLGQACTGATDCNIDGA